MTTYFEWARENDKGYYRARYYYIDWNEFFAMSSVQVSEAIAKRAVRAASNWVTCACGQQDVHIERGSDGKPVDKVLAHYGTRFYQQICQIYSDIKLHNYHEAQLHFNQAKKTLKLIDARSFLLLESPELQSPQENNDE